MKQMEFTFTEATPLIRWLDEHRDRFIGHRLERIYSPSSLFRGDGTETSEYPAFLVLDDICLCVDYLVISDLRILTADPGDFTVEEESRDKYGMKDVYFHQTLPEEDEVWTSWNPLRFGMGQKITDVRVDRFSEGFEDWEGELKPDGDYFATLRIVLEDGTTLCMQGEMPIDDGYLDIWFENLPLVKYLRPILTTGTIDEILENYDLLWQIAWDVKDDVRNRPAPDELSALMLEVIAYYDQLAAEYLRKHAAEGMNVESLVRMEGVMRNLHQLLQEYGDRFCEAGMNREYLDESGLTVMERMKNWMNQYDT